ncbi:protein-glutamate methylesterase/protein-glutamine glutaminase [Shewanella decolorationis]|uniref:Protein-glutamate methylesterase/protein-glutamine glutaminase n=1 Tax=Shewanella decolorationis S12 TaxID=1353536 RepID=A0ABN0PTA8_9GAMM|nr:chemotaxis response regulator protein-glutamate methylesterase [Shewanella decolorationis]ESE43334.1 response regulator receiver modulated methylesterase [Shewanella decolorationis S12]GLR31518.1 chemotaxis response regulator protein-glutamate methylesterase of group 3 operon [Shewanella decolorationis]
MIKVAIVDDSAVVRQVLSSMLENQPDITLLGCARDPLFALKLFEQQWPDVIILDIEMPRMDGITFLKKIMSEKPTPVVICSTLTEKGASVTISALAAGAVDIITKPKLGLKGFLEESQTRLLQAVRAAAKASVAKLRAAPVKPMPVVAKHDADILLSSSPQALHQTTDKVVALGTSTGGTHALEYVLTALPRTCAGIVVVQHMPEHFTAAFASRLNALCEMEVKEAEDNDRVMPGLVLIANGGKHMLLQRSGAQYRVQLKDGPLVSRHRPSVDVLFRSVANAAGNNALGIIMTGMGDDGARGLLDMHQAGATTLAQDEASCVVYGMPKEAVKLGAANRQVALANIAEEIINFTRAC